MNFLNSIFTDVFLTLDLPNLLGLLDYFYFLPFLNLLYFEFR